MPATDHGLRYPSPLDGRAVPADLMKLAEDIDPRLVWSATDAADRDARYSDLPPGVLVTTSQAPWSGWLKTGTGPSWATLYGDTGWVTAGFVPMDGWTTDYAKGRNKNGQIELRISMLRAGADLTANSTGGLVDSFMVTIPPQFRITNEGAYGVAKTSNTSGAYTLYPSGSISLADLHAGATIASGDYVRMTLKYMED